MSSNRIESAGGDQAVDDFTSVLNSCVVDAPTVDHPQRDQPTFSHESMEEFDRACDVFGGWTDYVYGPREEHDNGRREQAIAPSTSLPFVTPRAMSVPPTENPMVAFAASSAIQQRGHVVANRPTGQEVDGSSTHAFAGLGSQQQCAQPYRASPLSTVISASTSSRGGHYGPQVPANLQPPRPNMRSNQRPAGLLPTTTYPVESFQSGHGIVPDVNSARPPTAPTNSVSYYIPTWHAFQEVIYTGSIIQQGNGRAQTVTASDAILPYSFQSLFTMEQTDRIQRGASADYTIPPSQNQPRAHLRALALNPNPGTAPITVPSSDPELHLPLDQRRVPDFVELLQADLIQVDQLQLPQYNWMNQTMPQFREQAMVNVRRAWKTLAQLGTSRAERASQHEYLHRLTTFIRQCEQHRERQAWLRQQLPRIWNLVRQRARTQQGSQEWITVDTEITQLRNGLTEMGRDTVRDYIQERVQELHEQHQRQQGQQGHQGQQ